MSSIVVSAHDISDRVKAEAQLLQANSLLTATLEATDDGIFVMDTECRVTSVNSRFAEMWDVPATGMLAPWVGFARPFSVPNQTWLRLSGPDSLTSGRYAADLAEVKAGYRRVRELAASPAHVVPGHDPAVLERYPAPSPALQGIVARLD